MKETAPCPWCDDGGRPFLYLSRKPFMSYTVKCNICGARGPHVIIEDLSTRLSKKKTDEVRNKAQDEALKHWNDLRIDLRDEELNRLAKDIKP
jgi:hypothetical protein